MMDVSFLDELRVVPGDESTVLHLIEVAAVQIASALASNMAPAPQHAAQTSKQPQAHKTCLEIIRRAADNPYRGRLSAPEQSLPAGLLHSLVHHPLLTHLLVLFDYTHLRVIERAKRRALLEQLSSSAESVLTPRPSTDFLIEAAWSVLTSTTASSDPGDPEKNSNDGSLEGMAATAGTEVPMPLSAKANAQSPPTVNFLPVGRDSRQTPSPNVTSPRQETASPLSALPVAMAPTGTGGSFAGIAPPFSPPRRPSPLLPAMLPFSPTQRRPSTPMAGPAAAAAAGGGGDDGAHHAWTLVTKRSHQATRLFRMHHAAVCDDPDCALPSCPSMKHVLKCGSNRCPLPFCFGSKCALMHFQGCTAQTHMQQQQMQPRQQSSRACPVCRDYWERLAFHRVIEQHRQHDLLSSGSGHSAGSGGGSGAAAATASMLPPPPRPRTKMATPPRKRPAAASHAPSTSNKRGRGAAAGPGGAA